MKSTTILDKILLFKNIKIILLIVYPVLTLTIYLNWDYLYSSWFDYLMKINQKFEEPYSIILVICFCFYSFYALIFLYFPLTILDKKYDNNDKIEIKFKKESTFKSVKDILLFIISPILLFVGLIFMGGLMYAAGTGTGILSIIVLFIFILFIIYILISYLYEILKKYLR
ncbi:MAG: hypothetical protein WBA59_09645 [Moheibacter sp.]